MIGKKNAPYSSARRAQNQQTADLGSWARRMVGMETPTEKANKPKPPPTPAPAPPKRDPNEAGDKLGGMAGNAVDAIKDRKTRFKKETGMDY